jgi:transcriptional regulator with XRE-family HTH domain
VASAFTVQPVSAAEQPVEKELAERAETPLGVWMKEHGVSIYEMAKLLGVDRHNVRFWLHGKNLPGLVVAFRIEKATNGEVPAAAWLGTELGKRLWKEGTARRKSR